jgi:hypothetical protein
MTRLLLTNHKKETARDRDSQAIQNSTLQAIFVPQFSACFKAEVAIHDGSGDGDVHRHIHST